ncbi:phospholipase D-like domain-containing protein [Candidatus Chlamydia sanziniae]|uniref:phospholipase D n=1 Tax=Candidatus Chlamydia sanziniae TaxID=1806891 RepID=A0A1A9HYA6_9CHLA|nr:phospholipase D-like domain-containing protein [Candidatus Chlamydia sanziniae]ANH79073.1 Phospholipase D endonuclease superfamily [Candidatus Chlamydia sanziniae]
MKNKQEAKLRIFLIICTTVFLGILAKAPNKDTFQTFLKSEEPVIYSKECNEDMRQILCDAIDHAEKEIFIRIYYLSEPKICSKLHNQMQTDKNITIHYQSYKAAQSFLQSQNVALIEHPKIEGKLMHQKALAIDKKYAWLGSANYTQNSLVFDNNLILGMKSPKLCDYIIRNTSGNFLINNQFGEYFTLPQDREKALSTVLEQIKTARKTVLVAMYALTHSSILQALYEAHQRGVKVDIMIDKAFKTITLKQLGALGITHLPIAIKTSRYRLHHKFAVIDNRILLVGSINWSRAGFHWNEEDLLILHDLTKRQNRKLNRIWRDLTKYSVALLPYTLNPRDEEKQAA